MSAYDSSGAVERDAYRALCPCRSLLDLLANKWSALAIGALEGGPQRFGQLQRKLEGVSPKVLTQTLRRAEDAGLVNRTVFPAVPLHVEYSLTDLGRSAAEPLSQLRSWAAANIDTVLATQQERQARPDAVGAGSSAGEG